MRIDSHQHFWSHDERQYPWIPKGSPLHRDWLPDDLAREEAKVGIDGSVAVQARQSLEESRWLLTLADHSPRIKAVVGWVDLCSERVEEQLEEFTKHPRFVGVRHVVQDEPDDRFLLRPDFLRGISKLKAFRLTYDILIYPKQLPAAIELSRRFPEQPFVVDHLAKPRIKERTLSPWREQMHELGQAPNVSCKLSGMVTEADRSAWKAEDFEPYLDAAFASFGEDRLMFGSDWPVCLLAASYAQVHEIVAKYLERQPASARDKVMGLNAARFYRIAA